MKGAGGLVQALAETLFAPRNVVQKSTPTDGQTISMLDTSADGTLFLTPAGTLATLTVTLPTNANSVTGQIRRIATTQTITTLTVNGAGTILGNVTTILAAASLEFQKMASDTWVRLT